MSYSGKKGWITKPKPGVRIDPTHPLSRGLVGCWLFNEGAGNVLHDISNVQHHGTLTNMDPPTDWVGSAHGGALHFDGADDFVELGTIPVGHPLQIADDEITITVWVRQEGLIDAYQRVIDKSTSGSGANGWSLAMHPEIDAGERQVHFYAGGVFALRTAALAYELDRFYFIVATGTGTANEGAIYINGLPASLVANLGYNIPEVQTNARIATWNHATGREFEGLIDQVSVYNRALSAQEVKQLYTDPYCNLLRVPIRRYSTLGAIVTMDALTLASTAQGLTLVPGAISLTMDALTLASQAQSLSISPGAVAIAMDALTLAGSVVSPSIISGVVPIVMDTLTLTSSAPSIIAKASILLDALTLASSTGSLTLATGATSVLMDALTLLSSAPNLSLAGVAMEIISMTLYIDQARAWNQYIDQSREWELEL